MKNIYLPVVALLFVFPALGQSLHHSKTENKSSSKSTPVQPDVAQVIQAIEAKMVRVDGGSYSMGCANEQDTSCYYWEKPLHLVIVDTFYISKTPVTQKEWLAVMGGEKPWFSKDCPDCPAQNISWYDALVFMSKLNQVNGKFYRFPTEAEWEWAAMGGNDSKGYKYAGSNNLDAVAWYENNSSKRTHPVGQKLPNELGLYDMCGNVWQWCADWFDDKYYSHSPRENPKGPDSSEYRSCRGGSWWSSSNDCRITNRDRYPADARDDDVGFRLVHKYK